MQTFLPYKSFYKTALCLDYRRLGKQRVEAYQILNVLDKIKKGETKIGWANHPAVLMWKGYENALILYYNTILVEWIHRGYKNNMDFMCMSMDLLFMPKWLGDEEFHGSHRANLLRKDLEFYSKYGWKESPELPYVWPVERNV